MHNVTSSIIVRHPSIKIDSMYFPHVHSLIYLTPQLYSVLNFVLFMHFSLKLSLVLRDLIYDPHSTAFYHIHIKCPVDPKKYLNYYFCPIFSNTSPVINSMIPKCVIFLIWF